VLVNTNVNRAACDFVQNDNKTDTEGFEVLTAVGTKMAVSWFVAPCRLIALMMEAAQTFETLVHS
jgi:hypothetical protein